jgi:hypothetical protein
MEGFQAIAKRFINTTKSHLFITGKAGTGKTTFLKNLSTLTHKTFIVVAPTGIAALNAGGVTIHSQFLLPFGAFLPDRLMQEDASSSTRFYTQNTLARKHSLNSTRKQVLRSIELLVIDEVSMLRADLLDAIDYRMRSARGNFTESFGGVQVLFIGDLYQLPPVVKRDEDALLKRYYKTPWFYEAKALEKDRLVFIEFDKIFRQHDDVFIYLLNNLRNNIVTPEDIAELNKGYRTPTEIATLQEVVTLTTHNYKADELNTKALQSLSTPSFYFEAKTEGEFPENMYPVLHRLELKVGAQIMFVRNDTGGEYFNGKLATVKEITGGEVWVQMAETKVRYKLKHEQWENKKYTLQDDQAELDEEIIGSFEQFPVKLAWAITVHKSQGLTFDKAIIDVSEAFADGQVYVAMSRLRSLDGLILRTHINHSAISTDKNVADFVALNNQPDRLANAMKERQQHFLVDIIGKTFDFSALIKDIRYVIKDNANSPHKDYVNNVLEKLATALTLEKVNTDKFRSQLATLLSTDQSLLLERIGKGSTYYRNLLSEKLKTLLHHQQEMRQHKRVKTYLTQLTELDVALTRKLEEVDKALVLTQGILNGVENFDVASLKQQRLSERAAILGELQEQQPAVKARKEKKQKKIKTDERSTYEITIDLLKSGMTTAEIAKARELAISTIEGHLAKAVESGTIPISSFVKEDVVQDISSVMHNSTDAYSLSELNQHFKGKYGFGVLKAVVAHTNLMKEKME